MSDEDIDALVTGRNQVRLLLDTVTFIMAVQNPERLSPRAFRLLEQPGQLRDLSVVSLIEIVLLPSAAEHALAMFDLPLYHPDPFDRQLSLKL
jgi:PIN domain nuclease of toxin-antitoxin system